MCSQSCHHVQVPFAMSMFKVRQSEGSEFLRSLAGKIDVREFDRLRTESGFVCPNDYISVEELTQVLASHEFPQNRHYEYEWAIHESGFESWPDFSVWMQMFLAALYVYCNKRKDWAMLVESDYHYAVVQLSLQRVEGPKVARLYLGFIEWLCVWVEADVGYDDYFCLLTWTLLRRLSGAAHDDTFLEVLNALAEREPGRDYLCSLTDSVKSIETWYQLHEKIPCPQTFRSQFDKIILGVPPKTIG